MSRLTKYVFFQLLYLILLFFFLFFFIFFFFKPLTGELECAKRLFLITYIKKCYFGSLFSCNYSFLFVQKPTGLVSRSSLKLAWRLLSSASAAIWYWEHANSWAISAVLPKYLETWQNLSKAGRGCLNNLFSHSTKHSTATAGTTRGA